jgi:ABC-type Mn2+/Zn2+ transport system permease subunit
LFPLIFAILASIATYLGTERLTIQSKVSKSTLFASVFALLLACGYFVSALFPALESHMTQIYFGDLATLLEHDAQVACGLGTIALAMLSIFGNSFQTNHSS